MSSANTGITGSQTDFLQDCWQFARRRGLGAHGTAGSLSSSLPRSGPCDPLRSAGEAERKSPDNTGESAVRSRDPRDRAAFEEHPRSATIDWERCASTMLASIDEAEIRSRLRGLFERRLAVSVEAGTPLWRAAKSAYINLACALVDEGIEFTLREDELDEG